MANAQMPDEFFDSHTCRRNNQLVRTAEGHAANIRW